MNIIFDARYINMSGIGTHIKNIIKGAIKNDSNQKITFLFSKKNNANNEIAALKKKNHSIIYISSLPFTLTEHIEIYFLLKKKPNIIFHTPHFNTPFLLPKNIKVICTIHDIALDIYPEESKSIFHKKYYQLCMKNLKKSTAIITVSEYTKKSLIDQYNVKNIHVIYNTFDPSDITPSNIKRKDNALLFVGINKTRKNLPFLLNVMAQLPPDIHLTIVGAKNSKSFNIDNELISKKLTHQVTNLGYVDKSTLSHLYKTSSALIFPSLLEGFGYPLIEAAAYQLPVICSNQSALPEIGNDGCLYFDPTNINDCKEKIITLLNSKELQSSLITKNYNQLNRFDVSHGFNQLSKLYKNTHHL